MLTMHPQRDILRHNVSSSSVVSVGLPRANLKRFFASQSSSVTFWPFVVTVIGWLFSFVLSFFVFQVEGQNLHQYFNRSANILLVLIVTALFLKFGGLILQIFNLPRAFSFNPFSSFRYLEYAPVSVSILYLIITAAVFHDDGSFRSILWIIFVGYLHQFSYFSSAMIRQRVYDEEDVAACLLYFELGPIQFFFTLYDRMALVCALSSAGQLCILIYLGMNASQAESDRTTSHKELIYAAAALFGTAILSMVAVLTVYLWRQASAGPQRTIPVLSLACEIQLVALVADEVFLLCFGTQGIVDHLDEYLMCKACLWILVGVFWCVVNVVILRQYIAVTEGEVSAKKTFIGYLSHEIRNPISTTILGIDILLSSMQGTTPEMSKSKIIDVLEDLRSSCEVATTTLSEVLMFDKIKSNLFTLDIQAENALRFAMATVKPFRLQAQASRIDLNCVTRGAGLKRLTVDMDKHKMIQVMRNLLSNAFKFTPAGGCITVQISTQKYFSERADGVIECVSHSNDFKADGSVPVGVFRVAVVDSGAGISENNLSKLFGQYVQFHAQELQGGKGSGLGLWISRMIVEMHGGMVGARSDGEGKGTTIFFELPYYEAPRNQAIIRNKAQTAIRSLKADDLEMTNVENVDYTRTHASKMTTMAEKSSRRLIYSNVAVVAEDEAPASSNGSFASINLRHNESGDMISNLSKSSASGSGSISSRTNSLPVDELRSVGPAVKAALDNPPPLSPRYLERIDQIPLDPLLEARQSSWSMQDDNFRSDSRKDDSSFSTWRAGSMDEPDALVQNQQRRYSMLIVDDGLVARKLVGMLVSPICCTVDYAENGLVAVAKVRESIAKRQQYDVILIDLHMPVKNGPTAVREIRALAFIGIIVGLSAAGDDDMMQFSEAGVDAVLTKPLKMEDLHAILGGRAEAQP